MAWTGWAATTSKRTKAAFSAGSTGTLLLMAPLAACNQAPPDFGFDRGAYREDSIAACSEGMRLGGAALEVANRICSCGIDRFLNGKTDAMLQEIAEGAQQEGKRAAVRACLAQEEDLGPVPDDLVGPAGTANAQEIAPELPAGPPAQQNPEAASSDGVADRSINQARGRAESSEVEAQAGNEVNTSRWQSPR